MSKILFPHDELRPIQEDIVNLIAKEIDKKNHLILHAPTGLGKTAASIAPTLSQALDEGKKIFFLTSKNTQHKIAVETLKAIKHKFNIGVKATDIVGKKWMCIQPGVSLLSSNEFSEYCKALREEKRCEFYENLKDGESISPQTKVALSELNNLSPVNVEQIINVGEQNKLCPYELGMMLAAKSHVIITDYYYLFHPNIRETFLKKNNIDLSNCIIIIDEGHNLPNRIKDLATQNLSTTIIKRAITEAKKFNYDDVKNILEQFLSIVRSLLKGYELEEYTKRDEFISLVSNIQEYTSLAKDFHKIADVIREEQKQSSIGIVASFLDAWLGNDDGFTRIISKKKGIHEDIITLSYRCMDPSILSKEVIEQSAGTILMSGTLTPTKMYGEVLGFPSSAIQETYPSPFPEENRLNLIIAKTSTKFTTRSEDQYKEMAQIITDIINVTPGNSAIFFPSYMMKDAIDKYLTKVEKTVFHERKEMNKVEKDEMINRYRGYKKIGAALLAVMAGSYGEGIDLPGDELKAVVVVGLPLTKPDLETKALIDYYDSKFKKGWDYGYVFPAFNKIIQSAGRCIRSATDKGVIVFLDERFTWPRYYRCFPESWKIKVSVEQYKEKIEKFFTNNK